MTSGWGTFPPCWLSPPSSWGDAFHYKLINWLFDQITNNPHFSDGLFSSLAGGALRSGTLAFSTFVGWETFTYYQWQVFGYLWFSYTKTQAPMHKYKHCQRHNGPQGWVLVTKVTSLGHIKSSQTNLGSNLIFIIPTKQQLQNLIQLSAFRLNFKILNKRSFIILTKNNLHNLNQGSAAKYWLNFSFNISSSTWKSWPNLVLKVWTSFC